LAKTSMGLSTRGALLKEGFEIVKLFSPEHGLSARGVDGAFQKNGMDDLTGLPVISLYGDHFAPTEKDLDDIDLVLFDIPDVGCRFYTYVWTMTHVMESCALFNKPFILADRPNPISGNLSMAEGPMLDVEHCSSFIGRWSIPIRHSCTLGELANYFAATRIKSLDLKVIPVSNWQRNHIVDEQEFTPTSPAIQNITTALLYPGLGLLEGINVNEGRGTEKPFRVCGAPWIDSVALQEAFMKQNCEGVTCQIISYKPNEGLYVKEDCRGLEFFISDINSFHPVATGLALLQTIMELYPEFVEERLYKTAVNLEGDGHLDKLLGVKDAFRMLKSKEIIEMDVANFWKRTIQPFLIY
jgi:uncharacterized protein YbbC (DUF1343 family)